ncbi:hypothetical protein QAD02_007569 [Eretmocerus hayati]|uniref:Uncharacterized protein n=1 Tax=Eretmocerus hayati TaxID=131215 RepID=A0ACC2N6G6_9HYME|nr:hypothetical protein QAD02_007569 [Eretmocerus hayati]
MEQNRGAEPQKAPDLRQMSGSAVESQSEETLSTPAHSSRENEKSGYAQKRRPRSQSDQDQEERRQQLIQQQVEKIQGYIKRRNSDNSEEEVVDEAVGDDSTTPPAEPRTSATGPNDTGLHKPRKARKAVWHDDFPFKFDKTSGNGTSHLECPKAGKKSLKCPVRLKIDAAGNRVVTGIHNHTPPKGGEEKVKFYAALRKAVQTTRTDIISIYHEVAKDYADTAINFPPRVVERSMYRWRAEVQKKGSGKVRNVDDYVKFFETPEGQALLEYDPLNKRKFSYKIISEEVETKKGEQIFKHLALYDDQTLEDHEDCTILQDDATFLSRPKVYGVTQLFTIMARNYDKCFPCIWILMSSKTAHAYETCLTAVRDEIWPNLKPEEVIADFEEAMVIAWKKVYPDVKLTGCYFHFTQVKS